LRQTIRRIVLTRAAHALVVIAAGLHRGLDSVLDL